MTMASRMQLRRCGRALVGVLTMSAMLSGHDVVGRIDYAQLRSVMTLAKRRLAASWCWRSGSLGRRRRSSQTDRGPPYGHARTGLLIPLARNRAKFFRIAIRFRQNAARHHRPGNRALRLDRRVPTQNL